MKKSNLNQGFTLVELMVVVAIIGILSAVAIPNFKKYQAKAKTTEAKLQLASIYSAEVALQADFDNFAACLDFAGFSFPQSATYYSIGFNTVQATAENAVNANNGGGADCVAANAIDKTHSAATKIIGGATTTVANLSFTKSSFSKNTLSVATVSTDGGEFLAGAIGYVSPDKIKTISDADAWWMDENKNLLHVQTGY